jgi:mediator of RNA polymerase II transcription subunit 14
MLPPQSGPNGKVSSSWAAPLIPLIYKGPAPILGQEFAELIANAGSPPKQPARERVLVEAKVTVTNRDKLALLERKLDRDVFYDHQSSQFTLRFRPDAGSGAVPLLRARMVALDRLIGIVDALRRGGKRVSPERVTLREIIFTYGHSVTEGLQPDQLPAPNQEKDRTWRIRLDFVREKGVEVTLEKGNPHLRVIDYLRSAANSPRLEKLPAWLVFTLPLFRALERLQESWDSLIAKGQGACYVFHKSLDWVSIRFALSGAKGRRVHLDIRPRDNEGELTWHVYRSASDPDVNNENDEFNKVLKQRVWSAPGDGFEGLTNGAMASWEHGIGNLVALIGEAIQSLAGTPPPSLTAQLPQQQQALPTSQQQQPPELQQPVPTPVPQTAARFPQQQAFQQQQQAARLQQQPNMQSQAQQQQQQRAGMAKNNTPVVVLD